ncbi:Uncharacterised protein [Chlamydia abortus]|uniref:Uncharacterized protein n=1 Tax=Paenibacillus residui TaxID=629724 RepID=A0ABW3D9L2_9BACL|nr:Uncharacterised protein [Chlamydia abortus]
MKNRSNNSKEQQLQEKQNERRSKEQEMEMARGKKLDGPNRPST